MKRLLLGAGVMLALTAPAGAELVTLKVLSNDMVVKMLSTAVTCAADNKITIAIVDRNQQVVASFRGPAATLNTVDLARRKAASAAQFGRPSGAAPNATANPPADAPASLEGVSTMIRNMNTTVSYINNGESGLGGAVPILVGTEVIGAIGLSGAGPKERPCAEQAIAAIQSDLK